MSLGRSVLIKRGYIEADEAIFPKGFSEAIQMMPVTV